MPRSEKTFFIDFNVLVHRLDVFLSFKNSLAIRSLLVFKELKNLKRDHAARGRNAKESLAGHVFLAELATRAL